MPIPTTPQRPRTSILKFSHVKVRVRPSRRLLIFLTTRDRQRLCSYRHFPIVGHQALQRILSTFQRRITRAWTRRSQGRRYQNRVLATLSESEGVYPLGLALLVGLVDKIALLEPARTVPASLTVCLGFQFLTHQLRKQTLGMSRT